MLSSGRFDTWASKAGKETNLPSEVDHSTSAPWVPQIDLDIQYNSHYLK